MKSTEARELGDVAGKGLRRVTEVVRDTHFTLSDGVNSAVRAIVGRAAVPVRLTHDAVSHTAYALTGFGLSVAGRAAGVLAQARLRHTDDERASIHDSRARHAIAVGLGVSGDRVAAEAASMAPPMHVRRAGMRVELTATGLSAAFADATPEVAVFVHGLFESEAAWRLGADRHPPYPGRLRRDLGLTPVVVRYNTGLHVSDNGRALAELLATLHRVWPVPLTRLVLIGHSMGGLVIHSALAQAEDLPDAAWRALVTDTVTLGSPHHGSPIARSVERAAWWLDSGDPPLGHPITDVLRWRSAGVRDMAHGNVVAADWVGHEPGDPVDHRTHPQPWRGARHRAVVGLVGGRMPGGLADAVGDAVVPAPSAAHARLASVTRRFADEDVAVVPGVTHLGLLNDERVYALLRGWLERAGPGAPPGDDR